MTSGVPSPDVRCTARSKRTHEQCGRAEVPFTEPGLCTMHGGLAPGVLRKAEERASLAERGLSDDPPIVVREKLRRWHASQARLARRQMRKAGVDLADYDREAAEQARLVKAEQAERAKALRDLAPEYVAESRRRAEEVKRWLANGRQGPQPALTADEELPSTDRAASEPESVSGLTSGPAAAAEPAPKPYSGGLGGLEALPPRPAPPTRRAPASARPTARLQRRGEEAKAARRAALDPMRPQRPAPERLPGGGLLYPDAELTDAEVAEYLREADSGPQRYGGAEFSDVRGWF